MGENCTTGDEVVMVAPCMPASRCRCRESAPPGNDGVTGHQQGLGELLLRLRWSRFFDNRLRCIPGPWGGTGMTTNRRRRFTADFKKRVALEALRGDRTVQAIAAKHEVHPNQVGTWKRQAVEGLDEVFARGGSPGPSEHEATIRDLHAKIGELTMERDFFQRGLQR